MIKKILIQLKWWLLPFSLMAFVLFVEAGTDSEGISNSEEGIMWTAWFLVIVNISLFVFYKKWKNVIEKFMP